MSLFGARKISVNNPNFDAWIKAKTYEVNPVQKRIDQSRNEILYREFKSCSKWNKSNWKESNAKKFNTIDVSIDTIESMLLFLMYSYFW